MGSMADDIIDGLFCDGCGALIDGESPGYPRGCSTGCGTQPDQPRGKRTDAQREARRRYKMRKRRRDRAAKTNQPTATNGSE